jgi:hypothetical protein
LVECRYAKCHSAECRGTSLENLPLIIKHLIAFLGLIYKAFYLFTAVNSYRSVVS